MACDLGLIIPTREEFDYLRESVRFRPTSGEDKGVWYEFEVPDRRQGVAHVLFDVGLTATTAAASRLLAKFGPELLAVVGIGGALSADLRLGDVVVASVIHEYLKKAKATPRGSSSTAFVPAGSDWPLSEQLRSFTNNFEYIAEDSYRSWVRSAKIRGTEADLPLAAASGAGGARNVRSEPKYSVLPVASGDLLVTDPAFKKWLLGQDRSLAVVEMEAAGAARAVQQHDQNVGLLVLRGVSDFADERKAAFDAVADSQVIGAWRRYAAQNAIELLLAFLASPRFPWRTSAPAVTRDSHGSATPEPPGEAAQQAGMHMAGVGGVQRRRGGAQRGQGGDHHRHSAPARSIPPVQAAAATEAGPAAAAAGHVADDAGETTGPKAVSPMTDNNQKNQEGQLTKSDRAKYLSMLIAAFVGGVPLLGHIALYWKLGLVAFAFAMELALLFTSWGTVRVAVKKYLLLVGAAVLVGFLIGLVSGIWLFPRSRTPHIASCLPRVVIGQPSGAHPIPAQVTAQGTATCIPADLTLWLIVRVGQGYYPQVKLDLRPSGTTRWAQQVAFGGPGEAGQTFTLYAVGAKTAASNVFDRYLRQVTAGQHPAALTEVGGTYPRVATYQTVSVARAPSPPPPPTISITTPRSTVSCQASVAQCQFNVSGTSTGIASNLNLEILVLVFPVHPAGGGWYVQEPAATIGQSGAWTQVPSYIGSVSGPTHNGDTLQIEAIAIRANATYNGIRLSSMSRSAKPLYDLRQIHGLMAQSSIVTLHVAG